MLPKKVSSSSIEEMKEQLEETKSQRRSKSTVELETKQRFFHCLGAKCHEYFSDREEHSKFHKDPYSYIECTMIPSCLLCDHQARHGNLKRKSKKRRDDVDSQKLHLVREEIVQKYSQM